MDVPHAVLGQALVHAVEECSQQATHHSHQDEEGEVHSGPQVTVLISIWTLRSKASRNTIKLMSPQRKKHGDLLQEVLSKRILS